MRNYKQAFWVSALLLGILVLLAFITYNSTESGNLWLDFAVQNHTTIMLALVVISVSFGFSWAFMLKRQVEVGQKVSRNIAGLLLKFLGSEERAVISFLLEKSGTAPQAELSRLPNMGKVKAFRTVQKLESKGIVSVEPRGKLRLIVLNEEILTALQS